jgi:AraC family transcriptional regulator
MIFLRCRPAYSRGVGEPEVSAWPSNLQTEVAQSRMVIWTTALRPVEEPIRLGDPPIIDAGIPMMHDSFRSELPILVAICAVPLSRIVVKFICGSPELEWWWNGKHGLESPKPGALMLLPPGTMDRLAWTGASDRFVISLDAKVVREVANELKSGLDPSFHTRWHFRDEPLRELLAEIGREAFDGWSLGALYADMLGLSLTTLLLKRYALTPLKLPFVRGGLPMKAIKSSLEFITDNLHRDLHLTEIASVAGLSPFHFARLFKAASGQTTYQYLLEQRLRRAKEYLKFGSLPISQIATEVGFPNHAHFARSFRRREGITPTAWRRSQ